MYTSAKQRGGNKSADARRSSRVPLARLRFLRGTQQSLSGGASLTGTGGPLLRNLIPAARIQLLLAWFFEQEKASSCDALPSAQEVCGAHCLPSNRQSPSATLRKMPSPERVVPGMVLDGRYAIERLVSEGGMGAIYRARDLRSGQPVAVKLILTPKSTSGEEERFEREARLLSELTHPNVVSYIAHGRTEAGTRFLVMEWLSGEDLASRLQRGPLSVGESLLLLRGVCEGLAATHGRGVIHRDLKPANVFLVERSLQRPKLIDLGIARRVDRSLVMTRAGLLIGTPEYMAPEQARGAEDLTCAADVFALGCMLYECLSGRSAFRGEHVAAVLCRILFEEPRPLALLCPAAPPALCQLIERMMRKEPAERPSDARAVLAALRSIEPLADAESSSAPTALSPQGPAIGDAITAPPITPDLELLSIVLGRVSSTTDAGRAPTLRPEDAASWNTLEGLLSQMGARAHLLLEGTFIVTLPRSSSARDQVTQALRAALVLRERWPHAAIAVLTGRGARHGTVAVGDVVDAGMRLLTFDPSASANPGVLLDTLSAQLLPPRFHMQQSGERTYLLGEDLNADEGRLLLGRPTPCVGREVELSSLQAALTAAIEEAEPQVVVVTGTAGQGKSRLRHEFLRRIERDASEERELLVMSGRGEPAAMPYAILRQALRRYCQLPDSEKADEQRRLLHVRLSSPQAGAQEPLFLDFLAELLGLSSGAGDGPARAAARQDPQLMREQLRRTFTEFVRAECRRAPLLLLLDDLQWCDAGTVDLIDHALGELRTERLCVLALGRPEVDTLHPNLWRRHSPRRMTLGRLSRGACERLIRQCMGGVHPELVTAERVERLVSQSDRNALLLEELIRAEVESPVEGPPQTVLAMLQARIGVLPTTERYALLLASVLGPRFLPGELAALGESAAGGPIGMGEIRALEKGELIELTQAGDSARADSEAVFRNDLVREAAYELLLPSDRAALHRHVARHLELAQPSAALRIAAHWLKAEAPASAIPWFLRAAGQALEGHDLEGVLRIVDQAIAAGAKGEALIPLRTLQAAAAFWQSRYEQCLRWALEALPALPRGGAAYFRLLADALIASSRIGDGSSAALHQDALSAEAAPDAASEQLICLARICFHCLFSRNLERADQLLARLAQLAPDGNSGPPLVRAQLAHVAGLRAGIVGDMAAYAEKLTEVVTAFEEAGDLRNAATETSTLAMCLMQIGQGEEAEALCRRNLARCESLRVHQATLYARHTLGYILVRRRHHLDEAQQILLGAREQYRAIGNQRRIGLGYGYLALLHSIEHRHAQALVEIEQAVAHLSGSGGFHTWALALHADILLSAGRPADALPLARSALEQLLGAGGGPMTELLPYVVLAEILCALNRQEEAREIVLQAQQRMQLRIEQVHRPAWRQSYLALPEQQRLFRLIQRIDTQESQVRDPDASSAAAPIPNHQESMR